MGTHFDIPVSSIFHWWKKRKVKRAIEKIRKYERIVTDYGKSDFDYSGCKAGIDDHHGGNGGG